MLARGWGLLLTCKSVLPLGASLRPAPPPTHAHARTRAPLPTHTNTHSQEYVASHDCPGYLAHAERRLGEEAERVQHYLDPTTEPKLVKVGGPWLGGWVGGRAGGRAGGWAGGWAGSR